MGYSRLGHGVFLSRMGQGAVAQWQAAKLSTVPPGQDPGLAAPIRYRQSQPRRGIMSVMGTSDRDDRSGALELLR